MGKFSPLKTLEIKNKVYSNHFLKLFQNLPKTTIKVSSQKIVSWSFSVIYFSFYDEKYIGTGNCTLLQPSGSRNFSKAHVQILRIKLFHAKRTLNSFKLFNKIRARLLLNLCYGRKIRCFATVNYSVNQFRAWSPFWFPISHTRYEKLKSFSKESILEKYLKLARSLEFCIL